MKVFRVPRPAFRVPMIERFSVKRELIIAIDGPSGAGKSTLSKLLAARLGYVNIDTGAMYRSVALAAFRRGIDAGDAAALADLCARLRIEFIRQDDGERVLLDDEDVSSAIRTPEISLLTSKVSACPAVREAMVQLQREMGARGGVVLEGRDIGSVVFPRAEVKFFLVATACERGRRRYEELRAKGLDVDLEQTVAEVEARDAADTAREHAPLLQAPDAIPIDTTAMSIDEVLGEMVKIVEEKRKMLG
jgi:CMP/dCMP kinase